MSKQWYYTQNGQQVGPVDLNELRQMAASGQLGPGDLVWTHGMAQWVTATNVPELGASQSLRQSTPGPSIGYYNPRQNASTIEYVGFWWRVLASVIDGFITNLVGGVLGFIFGFAFALIAGADSGAMDVLELLGNVLGIVLGWLYYAMMESSKFQASLGKLAIGVRVTDEIGNRISFGRATGRHFAKILSALILLIGFIMIAFTQRKQGLHDILAKTLVVSGRAG